MALFQHLQNIYIKNLANQILDTYCWWKKSSTTWDVQKPCKWWDKLPTSTGSQDFRTINSSVYPSTKKPPNLQGPWVWQKRQRQWQADNRINPKTHLPMTLGPIHYNIDQHKMSGRFKPRPFYSKNFTTSFHHFDLKHFSVHHDFSMAPIGLSSPARSHKWSWNATKECPERFLHSAWSTNCVQVLPSSAESTGGGITIGETRPKPSKG